MNSRSIEIFQYEEQREEKIKKKKMLRDLSVEKHQKVKCTYNWNPRRIRKEVGKEKIIEAIMVKNFLNCVKHVHKQIQGVQGTSNRMNSKKTMLRNIIIKLHKH